MGLANIMTSIADAVRRLSGREDKLKIPEMTTEINDANAEIDAQSALIAQIRRAIIGKATSGGASGGTAKVYTGTKTANGEEVYSITFESEAIIGDNDLFVAYRDDSYNDSAGAVGSEVYSRDINVNMCYYAGVVDASAVSAYADYYDGVITVNMGGWHDSGVTVSITGKAITFDGYRLKNGSWKWIHVKM